MELKEKQKNLEEHIIKVNVETVEIIRTGLKRQDEQARDPKKVSVKQALEMMSD